MTGIFLGDTAPSKIFVGDTEVSKVFVGTTKVRPSGWKPGANTVAYYPLDSTNTVNDLSGNSRNLTNGGYVTFGIRQGVDCADFTAANSLSYLQYRGYGLGNSARTISVWGYANSMPAGMGVLVTIQQSDKGLSGALMAVMMYSSYISIYNDNGNISTTGQSGLWYHIVGTQEGSTVKFYLNGSLIGTNTSRPGPQFNPDGWCIGTERRSDHVNRFNGYISNVILEDKVWTADDVVDYYNQTKGNYGL